MRQLKLIIAALFLMLPFAANADPIGTVQTFDGDVIISDGEVCTDCYANGWFGELVPDAGQSGSGDNALRFDSGGIGFHLQTFLGLDDPDEAFLGNYLNNLA